MDMKVEMKEDLFRRINELERSNRDLKEFACTVSHDLQEPLRVVAGFVKLLAKRYKGSLDSHADEFIDYTVDGVKRMQSMIKDLLEYSQAGTGAKKFGPTDVSIVIEQAVSNLKAAIEESGASIAYDAMPDVTADAPQLVRLFQNLIGNAIKFSAEQPDIRISAKKEGCWWTFSVRDNGIGMDPGNTEKIFVLFRRLHTKFDDYPGTGIGLAICRKIVERHGGKIWVESEPGKGSTFMFTMPAKAQAAEPYIE